MAFIIRAFGKHHLFTDLARWAGVAVAWPKNVFPKGVKRVSKQNQRFLASTHKRVALMMRVKYRTAASSSAIPQLVLHCSFTRIGKERQGLGMGTGRRAETS